MTHKYADYSFGVKNGFSPSLPNLSTQIPAYVVANADDNYVHGSGDLFSCIKWINDDLFFTENVDRKNAKMLEIFRCYYIPKKFIDTLSLQKGDHGTIIDSFFKEITNDGSGWRFYPNLAASGQGNITITGPYQTNVVESKYRNFLHKYGCTALINSDAYLENFKWDKLSPGYSKSSSP